MFGSSLFGGAPFAASDEAPSAGFAAGASLIAAGILLAGVATGAGDGATAPITLNAVGTIVPGAASCSLSAAAPGAAMAGGAAILPGIATGDSVPVSAEAPGCDLVGLSLFAPGAARETEFARAPTGDGYRPRRMRNQTRPDDIQE